MTNPTIHYAQDAQGIVTLTLDYPGKSMNVIDQSLMDDLRDCITRVAADPAVIGASKGQRARSKAAAGKLQATSPEAVEGLRRIRAMILKEWM